MNHGGEFGEHVAQTVDDLGIYGSRDLHDALNDLLPRWCVLRHGELAANAPEGRSAPGAP